MAEEEDIVLCKWEVDQTKDPVDYTVICLHPKYSDMQVRLSSMEIMERNAKARLMEMMYQEGKKRGIPAKDMLFKINENEKQETD